MISLDYIRQNSKEVEKGAHNKGVEVDVGKILKLDKKHREALQKAEQLRAQKNEISKELSKKMDEKEKKKALTDAEKIKTNLKSKESKLNELNEELNGLLLAIPNIPFEDVPIGQDENDNKVIRQEGQKPEFDFEPRDYMELARMHDLIDTQTAGKISGTRFGYIKNELVALEFALAQYAMEVLVSEGFIPVVPPVLIRSEYMDKLGYLAEGGEEDMYHLEKDDLFLVATSEQSIVPYHADQVLSEKDLPKRYMGFSTCFRREAGSYGKDTKGILRVHQFDKIEMVSFTLPEKSREEHKYLLSLQEKLTQDLEIAYQVIDICTGDTGFPMAQKFDIESWIPSENKYRETHSTSNATDFQARRLNTKFKKSDGGREFTHILNGTAYAIGRTLITILENHQNKDGSINVPKVLHKYTGFKKIG